MRGFRETEIELDDLGICPFGWSGVCVGYGRRHWSLDPTALLRLFPGMSQNPDRARENEQAPPYRWGKPEFAINDGGSAINVHRYLFAFSRQKYAFDRSSNSGELADDYSLTARRIDEREQFDGPRICRMKAVAEAGDDLAVLRDEFVEFMLGCVGERRP